VPSIVHLRVIVEYIIPLVMCTFPLFSQPLARGFPHLHLSSFSYGCDVQFWRCWILFCEMILLLGMAFDSQDIITTLFDIICALGHSLPLPSPINPHCGYMYNPQSQPVRTNWCATSPPIMGPPPRPARRQEVEALTLFLEDLEVAVATPYQGTVVFLFPNTKESVSQLRLDPAFKYCVVSVFSIFLYLWTVSWSKMSEPLTNNFFLNLRSKLFEFFCVCVFTGRLDQYRTLVHINWVISFPPSLSVFICFFRKAFHKKIPKVDNFHKFKDRRM